MRRKYFKLPVIIIISILSLGIYANIAVAGWGACEICETCHEFRENHRARHFICKCRHTFIYHTSK